MPVHPSLEWLQILDRSIHPLEDGNDRRWWVTDEKDTVSLQVYPGGLKEGVNTRSLAELEDMMRPKRPEGGLTQFAFRMVETEELKALESILQVPNGPGDTFIGSILIPFPDFTFVIEAECPERRNLTTWDTTPLADDEEYVPPPAHPLQRLRPLLGAIFAGLRVAPELRRYVQVPLPGGVMIHPARAQVLGINDDATLESLREFVGLEFEKIILPEIHVRASDGGIWFPNGSIPLGGCFLVLDARLVSGGLRDTNFGMLRIAFSNEPRECYLAVGEETRDIPPLSSIAISTQPAPITAIQLFEQLCLAQAGDEEFRSDRLLIIHRRDGIEARISAYANGGDLQFSLRLEPGAEVDRRYRLRWDSRW